jgi:pimeloyl-ACP methyl ester carboxylesterase
MKINNMEVIVEGDGPRSIVMIHGWPDTYRLWDKQVLALKDKYRCIRFTLPGFEPANKNYAPSLDDVIETIHQVVTKQSPGQPVTLLVHDWGCLFGYEFAQRYRQLVERVVGVDVGDAVSYSYRKELSIKSLIVAVAYQFWLALAWRFGGRLGDRMARWIAKVFHCPIDPKNIHSQMGYPYALAWLGASGGLKKVKTFKPHCPFLFFYGENKAFMFHSNKWLETLQQKPLNRVQKLPTGHWVMVDQPEEFNARLVSWFVETDKRMD